MNILYVEEDRFFADTVKRAFASQGIDLIHTTNANEVADLMTEHSPSAVVLDLRLAHLNGFELLQALKEHPDTQDVPLMVWSQLASQEDIRRCFALGACEYFLKGQHHPQEVARHIARRFEAKDGFTLPEWLVVMGGLLLAVWLVIWQVNRVLDVRRDDGQLAAVRSYVSAILAAKQERGVLTSCVQSEGVPHALYACRLCKEESCETPLVVSWTSAPAYERTSLDPEHVCSPASTYPCHVSIEKNGTQPLSTDAFKLRFFLARARNGLAGGQTHTINEQGVIE